MQNWAYSLTHFGKVDEALLAAFDPTSLESCLSLGFICWDVAATLPNMVEGMDHTEGAHLWDTHGFRQVGMDSNSICNEASDRFPCGGPSWQPITHA